MSAVIKEILRTEFNEDFIEGMRSRMVVSYYKYGPIADGYPANVNAITSLTDRLREYAKTGNTEFLIDAANFAMIEFMHPAHKDAHFEGTDSDQSPGRRSGKAGKIDHRDNNTIGTNPNSITSKFR